MGFLNYQPKNWWIKQEFMKHQQYEGVMKWYLFLEGIKLEANVYGNFEGFALK